MKGAHLGTVSWECRFSQPGVKLVNLTVSLVTPVKAGEQVRSVKQIFVRDHINVVEF